jgi:hypothetical protein
MRAPNPVRIRYNRQNTANRRQQRSLPVMQTAGCWPIASTTDLWQRVKCLVRLAFVMAIALVISACDEEHRAVSPGGVSDFATAVANGGDRESTIVETDDDIPQVFGQRLLPEAEWI